MTRPTLDDMDGVRVPLEFGGTAMVATLAYAERTERAMRALIDGDTVMAERILDGYDDDCGVDLV